jgi:transposase InsO family protein
MAGTVAAMDVRMAAALSGVIANVTAFCEAQGVSRKTFYKWRERFARDGVEGLRELSRRPHTSANATPAVVEEVIVRLRKELADDGVDSGPDSIRSTMLAAAGLDAEASSTVIAAAGVPSRATIARILTRRGLVVPEPKKRPKSSLHRFVYPRPNDCWQSDWSEYPFADGSMAAVAATLDDHSRTLVGIGAALGDGDSALVWSVIEQAINNYGVPAMSLTDNGWCYSGYRRGIRVAFEINLHALGCRTVCSTPYHPQTCGKIERQWQTMKRWLHAHGPYDTIADLNAALKTYQDYYNTRRPHRALNGATPAEAFAATNKARPADRPIPAPLTVTRCRASSNGTIGVGAYEINVGMPWAGHTLTAIADGDHILILAGTHLVRTLDADPTRRYQPAEPGRPRTHRPRQTP